MTATSKQTYSWGLTQAEQGSFARVVAPDTRIRSGSNQSLGRDEIRNESTAYLAHQYPMIDPKGIVALRGNIAL